MLKPRTRNRDRRGKVKPVAPKLRPLKGSPHLRIKVDEATIVNAIERNAFRCWIARTIQDQHPKYIHVVVDLQTIRISDPERGMRYVYLTPRLVQACLVLFDKGKRMRPFTFHLRGAHTTSMARTNPRMGASPEARIQTRRKLGRRRIVAGSATVNGVIDTVGGRAAPRHPSGRGKRTFGLRDFTSEDLEIAVCNPAFEAEKLAAQTS